MRAQRVHMSGRRIAFMTVEAVGRILRVQFEHLCIAHGFCEYRRRGYFRDRRVAAQHRPHRMRDGGTKKPIDQHLATPKGQADFILTYDKTSDAFKGIFVESAGDVGVWENPGPVGGGWTEFGYDFRGGRLVTTTRATFSGATQRHYAFSYWSVANKQDPGTLIESDDCTKR